MTIKSTLTDEEIKSAAESGYIFGQYIEMTPSCRRVANAAATKEREKILKCLGELEPDPKYLAARNDIQRFIMGLP